MIWGSESVYFGQMILEPLQIGSVALEPVLVLLALAGLAVLALFALAVTLAVHMRRRREEASAHEAQLSELKIRVQTLAEISVTRHGELARAVNERLDRMTHRVGTDLNETARKTNDSIAKLNERLAVIDTAQKNLTELSTNMVSLQEILANKQARGAFGQMRMETIVKDGLPKGAYTFQATLSNGKRPDCLLHMPNASASVVIDAKFPLEGFEAFRTARREEEKKEAARRVRIDVARPSTRWPSAISSPARRKTPPSCSCRQRRSTPISASISRTSCKRRTAPAS